MSRDFQKWSARDGIVVPRWMLILVLAVLLIWMGLKILVPPKWEVQRLDSPDGAISARLMRTKYAQDHFTILVREEKLWRRLYYSSAITNDYRTDAHERLRWSPDSNILLFSMNGSNIWAYDFAQSRGFVP